MLENLKESNPLLILAGIILIPIGVAVVSLWVDTRIDKRQRLAAEDLFQRQERLTVTQTIDAYFQGVGLLMTEEMESQTRNRIVIARTNALLNRLAHPKDKALVVRFISDLRPELTVRPARMLERASKPFIDLANIDLQGTDLSYINLHQANLTGADLRNVKLLWANLARTNLEDARLDGSDLRGAELSASAMLGASLRRAKIGGASFNGANLQNADLRQADASDFEFEGLVTSTIFDHAKLANAVWMEGSRCAADAVGRCQR